MGRDNNEPMAKRNTREYSEQIVKILKSNDFSAQEQKEILIDAKDYLLEDYMQIRDKLDAETKAIVNNIKILESQPL